MGIARGSALPKQNSGAPLSTWVKTYRTQLSVSGTKKGKYCVPKTQLRAAGDCRKFANGHCTATNVPRNTPPNAAERRQRFQVCSLGRNRSSARAGTTISSGKGGGMKLVTW